MRCMNAMASTKQLHHPPGARASKLWRAGVVLEQDRTADSVQPIIQGALEGRPESGQKCANTVRQAIGILTQVRIVAVQQLQLRAVRTRFLQPDHPAGMRTSDVR